LLHNSVRLSVCPNFFTLFAALTAAAAVAVAYSVSILFIALQPSVDGTTIRPTLDDDDDDDEGRINFSVALSPKTTRTHNNKPKQ